MADAPLPVIDFAGARLNPLSMAETVRWIDSRLAARSFTQHAVVNVAKLVHMRRDEQLRRSVEGCDIVNIDGMGVVWGARLVGHAVGERVAGIDLFHALIELAAARGYPVYLLGATDEMVLATRDRLVERHPALKVAGYHNGYFWDDEPAMVHEIAASGARLLFVAITSPSKENFIDRWRDQLGVDFVMGVGGTFDVVAGKVKRAPHWMQRSGLEWLYRVIQEPRRMFYRYFSTNIIFARILTVELWRSMSRR
ncbi:WecB/TagA/CpsF family glycosyltransferase [Sphingoaurantiacus capsulatus]|uniref:WecB/TagA/CpsF family glycosyltransferase n=1 Tax=Sphingoaurantiacus capsulatus TaxID=1771310 RepID=A0ABV7XGF8_9SPHN